MQEELRAYLLNEGATVVGIAAVEDALDESLAHLRCAVSIGVHRRLNEDTVDMLWSLQKKANRYLRKRGHKTLAIPPDSDRVTGTFVSRLYRLFSHKMAATCAGIGWIGRNGLLISPIYGPRLSFSTVLTDAPFAPDAPIVASQCGPCRLCQEHCPSGAITGLNWSRLEPFIHLLDQTLCRSHQKSSRVMSGKKPPCGLCITVCPYGRDLRASQQEKGDDQADGAKVEMRLTA